MIQENVIFAGQRNEPGARYARGELTAQLDWDHGIVSDMHDQGRRGDPGQKRSDVKVVHGFVVAHSAFRRSALALKLIEGVRVLSRSLRHQLRCEYLAKGRIVGAPPKFH